MEGKKFKEEYKKLNDKQKEAVNTIEGPVMVIAGPGTGKTTILTLRIANILKLTDTPPSGILALTFTESGAKNMKIKLREIIGETAMQVPIYTFHSFALSIISEFPDHFINISKNKQISEIESEMLIKKILQNKKYHLLRPLGEPDFYVSKILNTITKCKQEAWTPEMIEDFAKSEIENIKNSKNSISIRGKNKGDLKGESKKMIERCEKTILFGEVYRDYEKTKKIDKKTDFDDLIFELLDTLKKDKLLLQILQERFLYILVDEHQDTNNSQNLIIKLIADFFENPNLFIVGDEKQAIYRFQGASIENFMGLQKIWKGMKIINLEKNYRSNQDILDSVHSMIEKNYNEEEKEKLNIKLKSIKKEKRPIKIVIAPDKESEEIYILNKTKEILKKDKNKNISIIVRKNSDVEKILELFENHNIEISAERGVNIFNHPIGNLFFSLLEFLNDPSNEEALSFTIVGGLWKLNEKERIKSIKKIRAGKINSVIKKIKEIGEIREELKSSGVLNFLSLAADFSQFTKIIKNDVISSEVWRTIYNIGRKISENDKIEDPQRLIKKMLEYKEISEKKVIKIKTGNEKAKINITTAHSSKGLEFDYVFIPYATEENWIRKNRGYYFILPIKKEEEDDIKDERRLFYVAITRAKEDVFVTFSKKDIDGKEFLPLRFIDELDAKNIEIKEIERQKTEKEEAKKEKINNKKKERLLNYAKKIITEKGISVTALNHFIRCPNEFIYKSILKLPEPPNATSEKGKALHEAISLVWQLKLKNKKNIAETIEKSTKKYMKESLLHLYEKDKIIKEIEKNLPQISESLENHFNSYKEVKTEKWFEGKFVEKIEKENVEIKLHGKLDAIAEEEREIFIFDYKTGEAKSVSAIKGETKNESGDYFRQLIFYKILLSANNFNNKKIRTALVFLKPNKSGNCLTTEIETKEKDLEELKNNISNLIKDIWSGKIINRKCNQEKCKYCNLRNFWEN